MFLRPFIEKRGVLKKGLALALLTVALLGGAMLPVSAIPQTSQVRDIGSGKALFNQHCASCHFSETTAQKIGPGLKGLYRRLVFSDGRKVTDASLTKWIEAGGKNMPAFKDDIKPADIRELLIYIKTL